MIALNVRRADYLMGWKIILIKFVKNRIKYDSKFSESVFEILKVIDLFIFQFRRDSDPFTLCTYKYMNVIFLYR